MDMVQARELAKDETTSPEKLRELASSDDAITRQNVVMNPNVPPDVLIKLAEQFPKHVFNNPAIDLLLLETPNLFSGTSADILCSLLKRKVPASMIQYAANSTDERFKLAILMNPQTSREVVEKLKKSENIKISEAAKYHIKHTLNLHESWRSITQAKIQQVLDKADKDNGIFINKFRSIKFQYLNASDYINKLSKKSINQFNKTILSIDEMEKMALSSKLEDREKVAKNPNTPAYILEYFAEFSQFLLHIASNPNTPSEILINLLKNPQPTRDNAYSIKEITKRVICNPNIPKYLIEELIDEDCDDSIYQMIACNSQIPRDITIRLFRKIFKQIKEKYQKSKLGIIQEIIKNPNTPEYLIEELIHEDCNSTIYEMLAANNLISRDILEKLADKLLKQITNNKFLKIDALVEIARNRIIRDTLAIIIIDKIQKLPNRLFLYTLTSRKIIDNPYLSNQFLNRLIKEANYMNNLNLIESIARHPNLTPNTLRRFIEDKESKIRNIALTNYKTPQYITEVWGISILETFNQNELKTIASNFYITEKLLRELVNHKNIMISRTAASNPCASDEILEEWEISPFYREGSLEQIMVEEQRLLNRWESSISTANRLTVLLDNQTPVSILAKVSRSISWLERYAITQNSNTPLPILQRLTKDGNRIVRNAARKYMENKK